MFPNHYYCLIAGLPDLVLADKKLSISATAFREWLKIELHPADFALVGRLFLPFDHNNIINTMYQLSKPFDTRGLFSKEMIDLLVDKKEMENPQLAIFPTYMQEIIQSLLLSDEKMDEKQLGMTLQLAWYNDLENSGNSFLKLFAQFEQNFRNVLVALNGRKFNIPFEQELVGDNEVTDALKKSRSRDFGLASVIEQIDSWVQLYETPGLIDRELMIDSLKWKFLDDATFFNYFTVEKIMAFVIKLQIVERWLALDDQLGRELFTRLLADLQSEYEIPDEYKVRHGK